MGDFTQCLQPVLNWGATIKLVWLWCQHNLKSWSKTFKQRVWSDYVVLESEYVFYESRITFLSLSKIYFTHIGLIWDGCHTISICKLCVDSWWRFALYWATSSCFLFLGWGFLANPFLRAHVLLFPVFRLRLLG